MSRAIGGLKRKYRIGKRLLREILGVGNCDRTKRRAAELGRKLPRTRRKNLTEATAAILTLWEEYDAALNLCRQTPGRYYRPRKCDDVQTRLTCLINRQLEPLVRQYTQYTRQSPAIYSRVAEFGDAQITLDKTEGWIKYSRRVGYRIGIVDARYELRVLRGWTLMPEWLRIVDGMSTLAALRCPDSENEGEEIYRARWGVQRAGDVETVEGYIIRRDVDGHARRFTAHGKTIGAARGSITAQLPASVARRNEAAQRRAERLERIRDMIAERLSAGRLNGYDVEVTLADSRRAGNCPTGTAHWAERHFPGRTSALVSEVLAIPDEQERVLLACVAAVRRQRKVEV